VTDLPTILAAAFAAGLLGSAHCLGMCGGISGLFAAGAQVAALKTQLPLAIAYNLGRVLSYAFLGTVVATIGSTTVSAIPGLTGPVRLASGALIILVGLQVAFNWRLLAPVEKIGAKIWNRLVPHAKGLIPATTVSRAMGLGLIWGWLPCGLVYGALLLAATTAEPASGGLVMIAFGLGTMPAMVLTGLSASKLSAFMSRNRLGAGILIILLGLATLAMPVFSMSGASGDNGHMHHSAANTNDSHSVNPSAGGFLIVLESSPALSNQPPNSDFSVG
jgi:sulfite exporter TauE/SafE